MNSPLPTPIENRRVHRLHLPALIAIVAAGLLLGCQSAPQQSSESVSGEDIRSAAAREQGVIEVQPLRDPVVLALEQQAEARYGGGDRKGALEDLEQALAISPNDPHLLQRIAELSLEQGLWEKALARAIESYERGPKIGSLCARSLRTIDTARRSLGEEVVPRDYQVCQVQPRNTF